MGPTANVRLFFWPALTALIVTLVLRLADDGSPVGELVGRSVAPSRCLVDSVVTTAALSRPWALSDDRCDPRVANDAAPDALPGNGPRRRLRREPSAVQPPVPAEYARNTPRAILHAPVMDPHDDVGVSREAGDPRPGAYLVGFIIDGPPSVAEVAAPQEDHRAIRLARAELEAGPGQWPATPQLDRQLQELPEPARPWATAVQHELARLQAISTISAAASGEVLSRLARLVDSGMEQAEPSPSRSVQRDWLRAVHALQRRTAVWNAVWSASGPAAAQFVSRTPIDPRDLRTPLQRVQAAVAETGDPEGWSRFLLVDQLQASLDGSPENRQLIAHRFLSRLEWHLLTPPQKKWLENDALVQLAEQLRVWAARPVDYAALLRQIEWQETQTDGPQDPTLAGVVQSLRHSPGAAREVAERINDYYRNANLRLAISDSLLERLLPSPAPVERPVHVRLLDAEVRGTSRTETNLGLQLVPDPQSWRVRLQGAGTVQSLTRSERGPVAFYSHGEARFDAGTEIAIRRTGAELAAADVQVQTNDALQRIVTDYDTVPVLGPLVRSVALNGYNDNRAAAQRVSQQMIRKQVAEESERMLREQLDRAESTVSQRILGPLSRLSLQPLVVDLETTVSRLVVRYRIASPWQLASQSPRPRAPHDSLMSLQIHQSVLNNLLQRLAPTGAPVSFAEIAERTMETFDLPRGAIDRELRDDVKIQFAEKDPVTVAFDADRVTVKMKVVQMARDGNDGLRYFVVRADYRIVVRDAVPQLEREGVLQIAGPRLGMGDRVAIRAVFNAILSNDAPIPLVDRRWMLDRRMADVEVTQVEIRDGWLGIALGPAGSRSATSIAAMRSGLSR